MIVGNILSKYLGNHYGELRQRMIVRDISETGLNTRKKLNQAVLQNCWVVFMPADVPLQPVLAPSRIICIHKRTGAILFDGSEGGEQYGKKDRPLARKSNK